MYKDNGLNLNINFLLMLHEMLLMHNIEKANDYGACSRYCLLMFCCFRISGKNGCISWLI